MTPVFITGTGTDVGKTIASVVVANALEAPYWKPIQAGSLEATDRDLVQSLRHEYNRSFNELYPLALPASPHLAAMHEGVNISLDSICEYYRYITESAPDMKYLVIEGAGGLLVPLNSREFVADLIARLQAKVILVSRNYLGSINHSLLTAEVCRQRKLDVVGWIFNDAYMSYEDEIAGWSGYPVIGKIARLEDITRETLYYQSTLLKKKLLHLLDSSTAC